MTNTAENSLMTRQQRYRARKSEVMYIGRSVISSKAFLSLKNPTAIKVYLLFLARRRWEKAPGKKGKRENPYICTNNGEIEFSYIEAESKYGISESTFRTAIDRLVEAGLIDIMESGYGLQKSTTKYAISERWRTYGTPEFVQKYRKRRPERLGFKKENQFGRNCQKKEISNVADNSVATVTHNSCTGNI